MKKIITILCFSILIVGCDSTQEEMSEDSSELEVTENANGEELETDNDVEVTEYEYEIVEQEQTQIGDSERLELRVVTPEKLNRNQIKELLMQLEEDVEEDQLYIFLYENKIIIDEAYTLGRLMRTDGVTEIDAKQKNWDNQPSDEEYELYVIFMNQSMELNEQVMEEDLFAIVEDEVIASQVGENEDVDAQTVLDSISKVNSFMLMNEE